jgi:hypothetical protein
MATERLDWIVRLEFRFQQGMRRPLAIIRAVDCSFADTKFGEDAVEQIIRRRLAGNLA